VTGGLTASAAVGAPVLNPGELVGYGKVNLHLPGGASGEISVGFKCLMIEKSAILYKMKAPAVSKLMLYVKIQQDHLGTSAADAMPVLAQEKGEVSRAVAFMQKYATSRKETHLAPSDGLMQANNVYNDIQNNVYNAISNFAFKVLERSDGPITHEGKADGQHCDKDEDCSSEICAGVVEGINRCRPTTGFQKGEECATSGDCNSQAGLFCYREFTTHCVAGESACLTKQNVKGICAEKMPNYAGCAANEECLESICALTNAQSLASEFGDSCSRFGNRNDAGFKCQCRPEEGFKSGTHVKRKEDCKSGGYHSLVDESLVQIQADERVGIRYSWQDFKDDAGAAWDSAQDNIQNGIDTIGQGLGWTVMKCD
jgi:hypothetical protein